MHYADFNGLKPGTSYLIYARMAETDQKNPSGPSKPLKVKTKGQGNFKSEISIRGNIPNCEVTGFDDALVRDLCTPAEIKRVEAGADACGSLSITRLDNPSAADQALCEEAAARIGQNVKIGMYMDISIDKTIGEAKPVKISDTKGKMIKFKFEIKKLNPEEIFLRKFFVIRVHEGKAEQIPVKCGKDYFEFRTDHFSTYALAYQDTPVQNTVGNNNANRAASTGIHGTDTLTVALIIAGVALAIGAAAFAVRRRKDNR